MAAPVTPPIHDLERLGRSTCAMSGRRFASVARADFESTGPSRVADALCDSSLSGVKAPARQMLATRVARRRVLPKAFSILSSSTQKLCARFLPAVFPCSHAEERRTIPLFRSLAALITTDALGAGIKSHTEGSDAAWLPQPDSANPSDGAVGSRPQPLSTTHAPKRGILRTVHVPTSEARSGWLLGRDLANPMAVQRYYYRSLSGQFCTRVVLARASSRWCPNSPPERKATRTTTRRVNGVVGTSRLLLSCAVR